MSGNNKGGKIKNIIILILILIVIGETIFIFGMLGKLKEQPTPPQPTPSAASYSDESIFNDMM